MPLNPIISDLHRAPNIFQLLSDFFFATFHSSNHLLVSETLTFPEFCDITFSCTPPSSVLLLFCLLELFQWLVVLQVLSLGLSFLHMVSLVPLAFPPTWVPRIPRSVSRTNHLWGCRFPVASTTATLGIQRLHKLSELDTEIFPPTKEGSLVPFLSE